MVLELSKSFNHEACKKTGRTLSAQEKKDLMIRLMNELGVDISKATMKDGVLEMKETPDLKLHSLILQAEELGLDLKYTRKSVIEIC